MFAARTAPADFMRRMIAAHREAPWTRHSPASIDHHGSCGIRHGGACSCTPEIFLTVDGKTVEIDHNVRVRKETRQ
jgi:hypothetical protein